MIKRDEIVKRFLDECKTSQTNQDAVDKVQKWLEVETANAELECGQGAAGFIREEANHAGRVIIMLVKGTEILAGRKSSSVAPAEAMGVPGIKNG